MKTSNDADYRIICTVFVQLINSFIHRFRQKKFDIQDGYFVGLKGIFSLVLGVIHRISIVTKQGKISLRGSVDNSKESG